MSLSFLVRFMKGETTGGIILFVMALAALILCNSPLADLYQQFWQKRVEVHLGNVVHLSQPLLFWVNEGLMPLFFLLIGLELKRELMGGNLSHFSQIILPAAAALGGIVMPVLIYSYFNWHDDYALQGWSVPVATDIAFTLGVLSLFGKRVPAGLKTFLMTLAIFDDVCAILIIALFHSQSLSYWSFLQAFLLIFLLWLLNKSGVRRLSIYLLVGFALWVSVLNSGVHATVAGVILAAFIPRNKTNNEIASPAGRLEHRLEAWVTFFIMPLFALANAGLPLSGLTQKMLTSSIVVGTVLGLFIGKQLGVSLFTWLLVKSGMAKIPENTIWQEIYGVAILCGIGFTMSLFLGTLAFTSVDPVYLIEVRLGVLIGSVLSGVIGAMMLQMAFSKKSQKGVQT